MADKITFDDKVSLTTSPLPRANKCTAEDLNEIKQVVNANADLLNVIMPVGSIIDFAGNTAPTNWLICDGTAISRSTYSDLFSLIGTTFGTGDGSTTFNLPDLRGKTIVGKDENDTDFDVIGETGGEKTHTLNIQEIPSHKHNLNYDSRTDATNFANSNSLGFVLGGLIRESNIKTNDVGGSQAHNNLQPYFVLNKIIKAVKE